MKIEEFVMNNPRLFVIITLIVYFGIIMFFGVICNKYLDKDDSD